MSEQALFLGTGGSLGVPVIGCKCSVCLSPSSYNKRLRTSLLLHVEEKTFLIDSGPDFRAQALRFEIEQIDGLILTHSHYDHIAGLDELRTFSFKQKKPVPCLVSSETLEEIKKRYYYIFPDGKGGASSAKFKFDVLEDDFGVTLFEGVPFKYFSYFQKGMKVMGFRYKDFAYVVDIFEYPETIFKSLENVKTLVIDGLAWERTAAHLGIVDVIEFAKKVGCERTFLTHISHDIDHEMMNARLPRGIEMAYDGMKLDLW